MKEKINDMSDIREDIATIKADLKNLSQAFYDFRDERRKALDEVIADVGDLKTSQAQQKERISNLNIFQMGISLIVGAVATYLGRQP